MAAFWAMAFTLALTSFMVVEVHAGKAQRLSGVRDSSVERNFDQPLGKGHRVTEVYELPDGRGFVADLEVIEQTELYGADITDLRMTVRCV